MLKENIEAFLGAIAFASFYGIRDLNYKVFVPSKEKSAKKILKLMRVKTKNITGININTLLHHYNDYSIINNIIYNKQDYDILRGIIINTKVYDDSDYYYRLDGGIKECSDPTYDDRRWNQIYKNTKKVLKRKVR